MSGEILVPWTKNLILEWNDFVGTPESTKNQMAWTYTNILPTYEIDLIKKKARTKFKIKNIKVIAHFKKSISWVREPMTTREDQAQILKHEQGHLDLAELHARRMEDALKNKLLNKSFSCKGKTDKDQEDFAKKTGEQLVKETLEPLYSSWHEYETKYDDDTNHGLKSENQRIYDETFDKLRN